LLWQEPALFNGHRPFQQRPFQQRPFQQRPFQHPPFADDKTALTQLAG